MGKAMPKTLKQLLETVACVMVTEAELVFDNVAL
jgi:hypothetical protein